MTPTTEIAVCSDPATLNQWYPISALDEVVIGMVAETQLLSEMIRFTKASDGELSVWRSTEPPDDRLPVMVAYGYIWTSLGIPPEKLFAIPEFDDPLRRNMNAGSVGVSTSAPRAVENFLDLAHFPYVHEGSLGVLPHTEVTEYDVDIVGGEIIATKCDFFVPMAAAGSDGAAMTRYWYRVPHPTCVLLYYESPDDPTKEDIVGLFVQPMTDERVRAHNYMGVVDHTTTDTEIKAYQLLIFAQDKPILENQHPKLLPLDPRAETPIRADKSAIAYRRWLSELGVTYGVIR
jgi:phenylpropionate dioxygenase-like ring-hydroxylating dioxygenase large terminal subunit